MKCPDCRNIELVFVDKVDLDIDGFHTTYEFEDKYYKCPKCRQEYSQEDLEESSV